MSQRGDGAHNSGQQRANNHSDQIPFYRFSHDCYVSNTGNDTHMDCAKLCILLLAPCFLAAHDLETTVTLAAPAVIVRATYGGAEPVAFANIKVLAPGAQEFQNARTDRRGYFSFVPDSGGDWRVIVDDEEGHRAEAAVKVPQPFGAAAPPEARASRLERAALGLAVIFGLTGFWYGFKKR